MFWICFFFFFIPLHTSLFISTWKFFAFPFIQFFLTTGFLKAWFIILKSSNRDVSNVSISRDPSDMRLTLWSLNINMKEKIFFFLNKMPESKWEVKFLQGVLCLENLPAIIIWSPWLDNYYGTLVIFPFLFIDHRIN